VHVPSVLLSIPGIFLALTSFCGLISRGRYRDNPDRSVSLLDFSAVDVRYGRQLALLQIDLQILEGEVHALLGASGSGKTTLLRTIAGLEAASAGSIRMQDLEFDIPALRRGERALLPANKRPVALVAQNVALLEHLTVVGNVAAALPKADRDAARELLRRVELLHVADRFPSELSGGEQQRTALARALALRPRLMLLDEPFANLDPARRVRIRQHTFEHLRQHRITTVLVTHSAEEAFEVADRMSILHAGRIGQTGTPLELYRRPASSLVAHALGEVQWLPATRHAEHAVRTALGIIPTAAPAIDAPVMVRPEQVLQSETPTDCRARVERTLFLGTDWRVYLRLHDGTALVARTPTWIAPDGDVFLRVDATCPQPEPDPDFDKGIFPLPVVE
jgi:ABC-type Fe3+/spermidine/putrescine transport system ATPase subunit